MLGEMVVARREAGLNRMRVSAASNSHTRIRESRTEASTSTTTIHDTLPTRYISPFDHRENLDLSVPHLTQPPQLLRQPTEALDQPQSCRTNPSGTRAHAPTARAQENGA